MRATAGRGQFVEPDVLVGAAVMGDLHEVVRRIECAGCRDRALRRGGQVSEEQGWAASRRRGRRARRSASLPGGYARVSAAWPQHPPRRAARASLRPGVRVERCARRRLRDVSSTRARAGRARRAVQHGAHPPDDRVHSADVVQVEVREHEEVDVGDARAVEARRRAAPGRVRCR